MHVYVCTYISKYTYICIRGGRTGWRADGLAVVRAGRAEGRVQENIQTNDKLQFCYTEKLRNKALIARKKTEKTIAKHTLTDTAKDNGLEMQETLRKQSQRRVLYRINYGHLSISTHRPLNAHNGAR